MQTLWDHGSRDRVLQRVTAIAADARPRWGQMSAGAMLAHIANALRMATGALDIPPMRLASRHFPFRQGVLFWIHALPFPHGAPTAPELLASSDVPAEESKREIARLLDDFGARRAFIDGRDHPAFGPLSARTWGVLTYRHLDHHLRQFGG